jgi:hypothetical protein
MERPPVEPGDDKRAVLGERSVYVGGGEPLRACAYREACPARILALDGQQALGDSHRVAHGRPREEL